ncbi:hypothetical protein M6B38_319015 [Iris pallida]|uniref:Uncharacterized protein n=1 Tax=Iris pallida TaxID=29817 RepID=A0AAX6HDC7_IRIPA|nr:hypothetical protein M6B38_319015 [Iris pallida]
MIQFFKLTVLNLAWIILCSLLTRDTILGNTEDDELFFNSYYDPVLYPVTVPGPSPEDADPEATKPDC